MRAILASTACLLILHGVTWGAGAGFAAKPAVTKTATGLRIAFAVTAPTDVEVAVLAADGTVIRHLAAGVLGGANPPPEPLKPGLSQSLEWDGTDDFVKPATGGPFKARVRVGTGVKLGRFIGGDPYAFGALCGVAADEEGNVYIMGFGGEANQGHMVVRVFDPEGRYLREILPFPADLPPDAMKDLAQWDPEARAFRPRNLRNLNPDFYGQPGSANTGHSYLSLVSASKRDGLIFTNGTAIFRIDAGGAVPGDAFAAGDLWPKKGRLPNTGGGPVHLRASPDGKHLFLSGPYSSKTAYGHEADPRFPPARVYRMEIGKGTMEPFATLPTVGENPAKSGYGWTSKHIAHPMHYTVPHGPIHDVAADAAGNVLVADQDGQRVAVLDPAGKEVASLAVPYPDLLAVHPKTGALYVLTKEIKGYHQFRKTLVKFAPGPGGWKDAKQAAMLDLGVTPPATPRMALSASEKSTVLWLIGVREGLLAVEDKGDAFEEKATAFAPTPEMPGDWARLATDAARDELYVSNGTTRLWRFSGLSSEGGPLKKGGKPFLANDLAVGYDGSLYVRVSGDWDGSAASYSGPFWRLDRDLNPLPFPATGTHVLSPYIYSRYGVGFAERGIGVGPRGESYVSFMYKWVAYAIAGFGPDGKPLKGKYLQGAFPGKGKYPAGLETAVVGPLPQANGGIRVDLKGNLYVGMLHWPNGVPYPTGHEKDEAWRESVGSIVRFPSEGGRMAGDEDAQRAAAIEGATAVYPGLAPFSKAGLAGNTCCVCRTPRFDLDRFGRLAIPNAIANSVRLVDNAGNLILEFGAYGNFDSQFANPNTEAGKAGKPTVAVPAIPLAWPTCAGFGTDRLYVLDTYSRRVLRADLTWRAEEIVEAR